MILFLIIFFITTIVILPRVTNRPVLSQLNATLGGRALADGSTTEVSSGLNSQRMALLEATTGPEPAHGAIGESIRTSGGVALIPQVGPVGSLADVTPLGGSDQIITYTVRDGDSLGSIAKMFSVSKNTISWANEIKGGKVSVGDTLVILPVSGIRYTIKKGDSVPTLAKKYHVSAKEIAQFNDIGIEAGLDVGETLIIPDGILDSVSLSKDIKGKTGSLKGKNFDTYFIRPIAGGKKTQGIHGHNGVDLASEYGAPILASADGTVIVSRASGYNGGYGNFIVVSHSNGTQTLYGHLSSNLVSVGESVTQGQEIARMGSTGRSTGNHLHFEIHGARNPF